MQLNRTLISRQVTKGRRLLAAVSEESFLLPGRSERTRWMYPALAELVQRHLGPSGPTTMADELDKLTGLTRFEYRLFSQNGEDGVLAEICRRLAITAGSFVEFGVQSGREGNCVFLADVMGWSGLFIEMDPNLYRALERKYHANPNVTTLRRAVTPDNVQDLFELGGVPEDLDILSIDVDGYDFWIWRAIDRFRPKVVIIEYNSSLDTNRRLVQPPDAPFGWTGTDRYGASLGALVGLGTQKHYRLVHTELTGVNAFFVRDDLADALPPPEAVPIRAPNHFLAGHAHVRGDGTEDFLDLDTVELSSSS